MVIFGENRDCRQTESNLQGDFSCESRKGLWKIVKLEIVCLTLKRFVEEF